MSQTQSPNRFRKKLSAILLCRNEKNHIQKCLESLIQQDFPREDLEILVVDGMSEDGSREIIQSFSARYLFVKMVDNPDRLTPYAFNAGIRNAKGDAVLILNGHSLYPPDFFSANCNALFETGADNVGGKQIVIPRIQTRVAQAIAATMHSEMGAGNLGGKGIGEKQEPVNAETVVYGCYRKEVFQKIGFFDERLQKGQDVEFNLRLLKSGGKILRIPGIYCNYMTRSSLREIVKYYYINGKWLTLPLGFGIVAFHLRHLVPMVMVGGYLVLATLSFLHPVFLTSLLALLATYGLLLFLMGVKTSLRAKRVDFLFLVPVITMIIHFTAGFGGWVGIFHALLEKFEGRKERTTP